MKCKCGHHERYHAWDENPTGICNIMEPNSVNGVPCPCEKFEAEDKIDKIIGKMGNIVKVHALDASTRVRREEQHPEINISCICGKIHSQETKQSNEMKSLTAKGDDNKIDKTPDTFQLLKFEEKSIKGQKTKRFLVYSTHSDEFLGTINWRNGWRCYVMSYEEGIDMSLSCEEEIIKFMRLLK
jgi:hypothetical protein